MFDWEEYLKLANELSLTPNAPAACREAKQRCSISRAYYSAFAIARNFLRDVHKVTIPVDKVHSFVWRKFEKPPKKGSSKNVQNYSRVGILLGRLRDYRRKADYEDVIGDCNKLNIASLSDANQACGLLDIIKEADPSDLPDYS